MIGPFSLGDCAAYLGAASTLVAFSMKRIIPLRAAGIAANAFYLTYGALNHVYPALILHIVLLPLNVTRLVQMLRLVRNIEAAATGALSTDWLHGFTKSRRYKAGDVMFRQGDEATHLFYIVSGIFSIPDLSVSLAAGEVIGELGIVSPGNRRTQTIICTEAGEVLNVSYDEVRQLYFQNPKFGFYLLRLIGERMHANLARARQTGEQSELALADL